MANNTAAVFTRHYDSPMGRILLAADEIGLRGLWFDGQKYFARDLPEKRIEQETHALAEARRWLDVYFTGKDPDFLPARQLAGTAGLSRMSAQAVGGAVGHNEISIIIPCHRVVGTSGSLTGYAGGIERKVKLLELERADMTGFFVPKKGTAL